MAYDYKGNILSDREDFYNNITLNFFYDGTSSTYYSLTQVFKKRIDGSTQHPFFRVNRTKAQTLASSERWLLVANAGLGISASDPIEGIAVENGVVIHNQSAHVHVGAVPIGINSDGDFVILSSTATGNDVVNQGIDFAVCGWFPLIDDYEDVILPEIQDAETVITDPAQRQIFGQFGNGDYAIVTANGRDFDNSVGWTANDMQRICKTHNLKIAFNMDGGGSTCTVIGNKRVNMLYDNGGTVERTNPSFLVFNGTDQWFIPSEQN